MRSPASAKDELRSEACPECGGTKERGRSFCRACYLTLPLRLRSALYEGLTGGYAKAYNDALLYLHQRRNKPRGLDARSAGWFYTSAGELEAAGYRRLARARCKFDACRAVIHWWEAPDGRKIPLDPDTLTPHRRTCPGISRPRRRGKR